MPLITWSSEFSVGVQSIDDQHTILFEALNELHAAIQRGKAQAVTGTLLRNLLAFTREHFSAEEGMMASTHFSGLEAHREKHRDLTRMVEDYAALNQRGQVNLNFHQLNFLRNWLTNHILKTDREYVPWFKEHGVR